MKRPARLVYCYDSADSRYRQVLEKHLAALHREQLIEGWHEELIPAGDDVPGTIRQQVRDADVLLLLVSADFLASDRCQTMVAEALLRHDDRRTVVCPVIIRPCDWRGAPLGGLSVLPPDGNPVTTRLNQDEAWLDVACGLRRLVEHPVNPPPGPKLNPYRGLSAFQTKDQAVFFGREELTRQLWQALQRLHDSQARLKKTPPPRIFAVLGPSGSGKSSLVLAGLVPALRKQPAWSAAPPQVVTFTPGEHPVERLTHALLPLSPQDGGRLDAARLDELEAVLRKPSTDGVAHGLRRFALTLPDIEQAPLLVVVDQFEEVYAQCKDAAEQNLFVDLLLHAVQGAQPVISVVLTLRNDFLGETRRHRVLNQVISRQEAHVLVPVMGPEELRRAIALPAQQSDHSIDEAATELLLREVRDNETALPLLEFALTRIWEGMQDGKKPEAMLREIGGAVGALAGKAQAIYTELSPAEQAMAQRALVRLVQLGEGNRDTRRRAPIRELCGRGQTEPEVLAVLRQFATQNARLVTLSGDGADTTAEITHEALFDHWTELRKWINESRADHRFHDRAADATRLWNEDKRRPGRLWRPPDLNLLLDYRRRLPDELTADQEAFANTSEHQQKVERYQRLVAFTLFVTFLVASAGAYLAKERQRLYDVKQVSLSIYVEQGRQLLVEKNAPIEASLWLHRARAEGSTHPMLPYLLAAAMRPIDATRFVLVGHTQPVRAASFSPDGHRIVTAGEDKVARVWDADSGIFLVELRGHKESLTTADFSSDGQRILTASADKTARLWDAHSGKCLIEFKGHNDSVGSAHFSHDGKMAITASADKSARIWNTDTGSPLAELRGHTGIVTNAQFSPDGSTIVTSSSDNSACIWDTRSGKLLNKLKGHSGPVWDACFSPDGRYILTVSMDQTANLWDAHNGILVSSLANHRGGLSMANFNSDGSRIVTASEDMTARIWNTSHLYPSIELRGHRNWVMSAKFSPDGKRILTASPDHTVRIWDSRFGQLLGEFQGHRDSVWSANFNHDGSSIVTGSRDNTGRVWNARPSVLLVELIGHQNSIFSASFSPDGRKIITASYDKTVRIWDAFSGDSLVEMKSSGDDAGVSFSPDGRKFIFVSDDKFAQIRNTENGTLLAELNGHADKIFNAYFSPDSSQVVTISKDKSARVWDLEKGNYSIELRGDEAEIRSACFSSDGRRILMLSSDQITHIWDSQTGKLVKQLKGDFTTISLANYSSDGSRVITVDKEDNARVWGAENGQLLAELQGTEPRGYQQRIRAANFSSDGRRIATVHQNGTARLWDAESGKLLEVLEAHLTLGRTASFSPDGQRLLTTGLDQTARIWDVHADMRSSEEISRVFRCKLSYAFIGNVIVPVEPNPSICRNAAVSGINAALRPQP